MAFIGQGCVAHENEGRAPMAVRTHAVTVTNSRAHASNPHRKTIGRARDHGGEGPWTPSTDGAPGRVNGLCSLRSKPTQNTAPKSQPQPLHGVRRVYSFEDKGVPQ